MLRTAHEIVKELVDVKQCSYGYIAQQAGIARSAVQNTYHGKTVREEAYRKILEVAKQEGVAIEQAF